VRIIRPGALVDWSEPELPAQWDDICSVDGTSCWPPRARRLRYATSALRGGDRLVRDPFRCRAAARQPVRAGADDRGAFLARLRRDGWNGRIVWVPISTIACAIVAARTLHSLLRGRIPTRLAAWSILRPRRYDSRMAAQLLAACR
jgi:hypothetical protein